MVGSHTQDFTEWTVEDSDEWNPYHHGGSAITAKRGSQIPPEQRKFVAWDGEGINRDGPGKPQSYVLFGASTGDVITSDTSLHTFDLLDFILDVGKRNPGAFHVGYAFSYDGNMIVRSLHPRSLMRLHKKGSVTLKKDDMKYTITFLPNKWFSVTRKPADHDRKKNSHNKTTVKIFDIFSFYTTSFVAAYEKHVGPIPSKVLQGKALRNEFMDVEFIQDYWSVEIQCVRELAETLRKRLYGAGFRITSWHGPGSLASYALRQHGMQDHMAESPPEVREAAKYAYAGGRFEMFKLGRTTGPIYSLDINSAYPYGISKLPSLASGVWIRRTDFTQVARGGIRLANFGVYKVRLHAIRGDSFLPQRPGPLFHRDKLGNISFPWITDGWYWSPEVKQLVKHLPPERYTISEGWELRGDWHKAGPPFGWIPEMYLQRKKWKAEGIAAEYALKLCMNSVYGKLAQRVGWDEEKRRPPAYHQLEWAGWVTSNTRAMLFDVMSRIPSNELLAVETDGLYTTMHPESIGITDSKELGGWEIKVYDEILYVQSGMAWLRKGNEWVCKRRGLDVNTFSLDDCREYLSSLGSNVYWNPFIGRTTRFVGLGAALQSGLNFPVRHCVWQTVEREIKPGMGGKRIHHTAQCKACANSNTALESAHDMSIRSFAYQDPLSYPHFLPWEHGGTEPQWRQIEDVTKWLVPELS